MSRGLNIQDHTHNLRRELVGESRQHQHGRGARVTPAVVDVSFCWVIAIQLQVVLNAFANADAKPDCLKKA